jgi:hypothetical protein
MTCKGIVLVFPGPGRVYGLPIGGQPAPQLGQPFLPQQHRLGLRYRKMRFLLLATVKNFFLQQRNLSRIPISCSSRPKGWKLKITLFFSSLGILYLTLRSMVIFLARVNHD